MNGYLLDTNHCTWLIDGYPEVIRRLKERGEERMVTSVIVQGELVFMARNSERIDDNLNRVNSFLDGMEVLPVDTETAIRYGNMKAALLDHFGPRAGLKRRKIETRQLGFEENDLWIAAAGLRHRLTVVTSDRDFDRIAEVANVSVERWWPPELK